MVKTDWQHIFYNLYATLVAELVTAFTLVFNPQSKILTVILQLERTELLKLISQ